MVSVLQFVFLLLPSHRGKWLEDGGAELFTHRQCHLQAEQYYQWHHMNSIDEEQTSHAGGGGEGGKSEDIALQCGSYAPTSATRVGPDCHF